MGTMQASQHIVCMHQQFNNGFLISVLQFHTAEDQEQLRNAIDNYQSNLRTRANAKNLKGFVEAFLRYV